MRCVVLRVLSKGGHRFLRGSRIRPVLVHNCYECHSGDAAKAKGHLLLDTAAGLHKGGDSGAVVMAGHADDSLLVEAIRYEGLEMPPKGQLPDEVIQDFVDWINMGAPDPRIGKAVKPRDKINLAEAKKYWAFRPVKLPLPPEVNDSRWPYTNIDRFVRAAQEKEHLQPVGEADRLTLIRRVTFDLTGLPPTAEEVDAFLKDPSAGAYSDAVNRLLASPRFGERLERDTGSTSCTMRSLRVRNETFLTAMRGAIVITSSMPLTRTSRTIGSSWSNLPAIYCFRPVAPSRKTTTPLQPACWLLVLRE